MNSTWAVCLMLIWHMTTPLIAQTSIRYGDNLMEALVCVSTDTFTFQANAGDVVVIHVAELNDFGGVCGGVACFCFDQQVELLDSANNVLAVNSSPNGNNTQNRFRTKIGPETLPGSGTYKVTVRDKHNNGRGEYSIFLQRIKAPERAASISSGQTLLVNLNRGEVDTYEFEAWPLDRTLIDMTPHMTGNIDPVLELYNQQGQALALPDSGHIEYVFTSGGTFTLLAFSRTEESGTYRLSLSVEMLPNDPPFAVDDTATTEQNTPVAIDVLANDSDPDENSLNIASVTQGTNGSVVNNGSYIVYTPNQGFVGTDEFNYEVTDRRDTTTAKVNVTVSMITAVETPTVAPTEFALMENYPNPFNPATRIKFQLPKATNVRLVIYNVLGKKVTTLVDGYRAAGLHELTFDAKGLSAGVYEYVIEAEGFTAAKRMTLLK